MSGNCGTLIKFVVENGKMKNKLKKKPIQVGFDFDGVVVYNPARVLRPFASFIKKKNLLKRKELEFFIPTKKWEKFLWYLAHQTSLFPAAGLQKVKGFRDQGKINAYLITGRNTFCKQIYYGNLNYLSLKVFFSRFILRKRTNSLIYSKKK